MTGDIVLGMRDGYGKSQTPFSLSVEDRSRHVAIIGQTGTGKSTLLERMAIQDILAGHGIAFIDPHGASAWKILNRIPRRRLEDVIYIDAADPNYSVGFNLFQNVPADKRHLVASGFVETIKGIWPDFFGPRMEEAFNNAALALLECQNESMLGLLRMLADDRYRRKILKQVKDPLVRFYWATFERKDTKTKAEIVSPVLNKVGRFLLPPQLRCILGQVRSKFVIREVMDGGKIFIVNLSKGRLGGDQANLLGSLLVSQFHLAAMSRADVPSAKHRPFFLYVDEFQSFISDTFAAALSEVRKYGLCLTLSHQFLAQLEPTILSALKGNVGSKIAFRVGHEDAEALQKDFGESYASSHFTRLSNGEVCAKLLSNGAMSEPFLGRTINRRHKRCGHRDKIIRLSRERYTSARGSVERKIQQWLHVS